MSSTNTLRQVGLLIGLASSVVIGAAVVLWLWVPGSGNYFADQPDGGLVEAGSTYDFQDENFRQSGFVRYRDQINSLQSVGNGDGLKGKHITLSGAQLEYTQKLEASFTKRIERILEPLLGAESIRAQVTADVDFTSHEQTLETYNPDSLVLRNNEIEENLNNHKGGDNPEAQNKQRREVNSYELDKTISRTRSAIGRIDKLSIAVIVDDKLSRGVKGNTIRTPRTEDELKQLTDLVKKAIGFNARRGDIVNVMSTSFKIRRLPKGVSKSPTWGQLWMKDLFNKTLGALLVLLLIFAVIRPATKSLTSQPAILSVNTGTSHAQYDESIGDIKKVPDSDMTGVNGLGEYEKNMVTAARVVEKDPKLVAQIIKNWVSADGT